MEDGSQPLCYSINLKKDLTGRCWVCREDYYDSYFGGVEECCCKPGVDIYETAVLCKVFVTTTPAHDLDITTPIRYDIYDFSGKLERVVDEAVDEIRFDHWSERSPTHTIVLDGSLVEDSYRDIMRKVRPDFSPFDWDFKGKYSQQRYVEFATQRLKQIYDIPLDLVPENDHLGRRRKGASHARRQAGGRK